MAIADDKTSGKETQLKTLLRDRLGSRVWDLRVVCQNDGVILRGSASSYYAKQLAQHAVIEIAAEPILVNEIEVCWPGR